MTVNDVINDFEQVDIKLDVRELPDPAGGLVLVEGDRQSLAFVGKLFLALAEGPDGNIHLDPSGAGSKYFSATSMLGLYLNRK